MIVVAFFVRQTPVLYGGVILGAASGFVLYYMRRITPNIFSTELCRPPPVCVMEVLTTRRLVPD